LGADDFKFVAHDNLEPALNQAEKTPAEVAVVAPRPPRLRGAGDKD